MKFNKRYEQELTSLREEGKIFSEKNPALAPFLSDKSSDPDVERLIESFAFLTSKLQQRIDDNLPEISHAFLNSIWPDYLTVQPSYSIIQFSPDKSFKGCSQIIENGEVLASIHKGKKYQFKTTNDLLFYPIEVDKVQSTEKNDTLTISVCIKQLVDTDFSQMRPDMLRFYLGGNTKDAYQLYYLLLDNRVNVSLSGKDDKSIDAEITLKPSRLNLLDNVSDERAASCARLQHYFMLSDIHMFIDVTIDYKSDYFLDCEQAILHFQINLNGIESPTINNQSFLLNAVPIINVFPGSVSPVLRDYDQHKYPLKINSPALEKDCSVYKVTKVAIIDPEEIEEKVCYPISEYYGALADESLAYQVDVHDKCYEDGLQYTIQFPLAKSSDITFGEKIHIQADVYDKTTYEFLGKGDISSKTVELKDKTYTYKNITHVTPPVIPPVEDETLWHLISNLSVRFSDIKDISDLKRFISVYNFADRSSSQSKSLTNRVLSGLKELKINLVDKIYNRHVVRGNEISVIAKESHFLNEGDMYVFGSIINDIFTALAEVNSFNSFKMIGSETGIVLKWPMTIN